MTDDEIQVFESYLLKATIYFEYGSGGSTCMASRMENIHWIHTTESNEKWVHELKKNPDVEKRIIKKQILFTVIDIGGNPQFWGYPQNESKKFNWPSYSQAICISKYIPDLVLIDGRFRVACAIQVMIHCHESTIICIHDYLNRKHYHCLENFMDVLEKKDTLIVFRKRQDISTEERKIMDEMYEKYKYDAQ